MRIGAESFVLENALTTTPHSTVVAWTIQDSKAKPRGLDEFFDRRLHAVHGGDQGIHATCKGNSEVIWCAEWFAGNHHEMMFV